jgi:hypothetical protein
MVSCTLEGKASELEKWQCEKVHITPSYTIYGGKMGKTHAANKETNKQNTHMDTY